MLHATQSHLQSEVLEMQMRGCSCNYKDLGIQTTGGFMLLRTLVWGCQVHGELSVQPVNPKEPELEMTCRDPEEDWGW